MSEAILHRYDDPSGVSGTGPVAEIFEATDGAVAIRWRGDRPSWGLWADIRDLEAIHGHEGKSVVEYLEPHRLLRAYQRVMPFIVSEGARVLPIVAAPHPDYPDRLRLIFHDQKSWRFWTALLDGSTDVATHVEVNGELRHRWIDPEGDIWMEYFSPLADDNDPLETFHREDR